MRCNLSLSLSEAAKLKDKAAALHRLNRTRCMLFQTAVVADSAMDVMLSLFVGELQQVPVNEAHLSAANMLSREETQALVDKLVQAGLAVRSGIQPEGRAVGLTPLGSVRMRSFIGDYPDV